MNELQEIEVVIGVNGHLEIQVRGAKGPQCLNLTQEMEQLLGGHVVERELTFEYDQAFLEDANQSWLRQGD